MRLLGKNLIEEFIDKYPQSKNALLRWKTLIEQNNFKHYVGLKKTFPSADLVNEYTVFNVGGNKIRTITLIEYGIQQVLITGILTHREYDAEKWKR